MFSGNLINELMAMVARVEQKVQRQADEAELERWYVTVTRESTAYETNLLGVA